MPRASSSLRACSFPLIHPLVGSEGSFTSPQMGEMIDRGSREGSCRAYISEEAQTFFFLGERESTPTPTATTMTTQQQPREATSAYLFFFFFLSLLLRNPFFARPQSLTTDI